MGLDLGMKGDEIPDSNHIARFCRPKQVVGEQIQGSAFLVRRNEESLSVNWLEFLGCSNREQELMELRKVYAAKFSVGASAKIAVLNVGIVGHKVLSESPDKRKLNFLHNQEDNDPSHSGIYNLKHDDMLIAELICEAIQEAHPARPQN